MRIAFYTDAFYPLVGGVSTAIVNLAQGLAERGHQVYIQAPKHKQKHDLSFFHPNVQLNYCPAVDIKIYPDFRLGTGLPFSLKQIRTFQPDIIHVHTPLTFGLEGILTAKALKKPLIQTFHTYFMDKDAIRLLGINNRHIARIVEQGGWSFQRNFSRNFSHTIAPTLFVAKDLKKEKTPGKILVLPNILEKNVFCRAKKISSAALPHLIFIGRLSVEKRVNLLLKTLAVLKKQGLLFQLIVVGDGPQRDNLMALSLKLSIAEQVSWLGSLPHARLLTDKIYRRGDIFFTLSRFETFGYTTVEAMAQGLPVLALSSRANKETIGPGGIILPGSNSETATIKNAVKVLAHYQKYDWNSLALKANTQAQKYHPAKVLPLYEELYQEILQSKKN